MNHHDTQIVDDVLHDIDAMRLDAGELVDDDVRARLRRLLDDLEDHVRGILRRHRPRPEEPLIHESDGSPVDLAPRGPFL